MLWHERLPTTWHQLDGLGCLVKAKATAAAEAAGRPPPSERLLCSACRAAVEAQIQLSMAERQLAHVEQFPAEHGQRLYLDILMQVCCLPNASKCYGIYSWLQDLASFLVTWAAALDCTGIDRLSTGM
jgi:hypothetical protein